MCEVGREGRWEVVKDGGCAFVSGERSGPVGLDAGMGETLPSVEVT